MCNPWVAWLGVLLPLIKFTHSVLKPALPPVIKNQPFNIFWAVPTMQCQHFFNVDLNLQLFNIISNPLETQRGSTIAIFYPNELGYYPYFSQDGKPFNGGIPQNISIPKHLKKTTDDIAKVVSWWRSEGLIIIDWESWKPQWDRNWGNRLIYKNHSLAFTRNLHPDWSEMKVKTVAQQEFENSGKNLMSTTLTLALEMRPKCLWGFYLYPDCYNYDYRINPQMYTGKCPDDEILRNDQLQWLWEKSTALYTSIYLDKILKSSLNALKFVHYRVREAMRIAEMARHDYVLPVFIFSRPFYVHSIEALSQVFHSTLMQKIRFYLMKVLSDGQLRLCVVQPIHLTSWLLIFFILKSISSLKPARLPIYQRKPFIAAWNAPTDQCLIKYNIGLNLKMFQVIGSPLAKARGQNITIFYVNRLGYYPWYTSQGVPINGGLPQNISLQVHLEKADQDINYYIPAEDFNGLAVIDWEYWRPQWARNWNTKDVYRQKSRKLISDMQENVSATDIEYLAKATFEESAKAFMKETIELGIKSRPKGLWGYYLYPDCHNYNVYAPNYTGSCPEEEVLRNNELSWLWNSSAALYPSIGVRKSLENNENILRFSRFRVHESLRISTMTSHDYALPIFVYTRLGYRNEPLFFLSKQDLISTIGESAALGAAGIVIWGDMNLTSSEGNCTKVKQYVSSDLGHYIVNVTRAAEVCSLHLCRSNGRCIRKVWKAPDYLHLNPASYHIEASKDGEFIVKGKASDMDLEALEEKFSCHCYQGYEGADCRGTKTADGCSGVFSFSSSLITLCLLVLAGYQSIWS
ncbi:hyaluronidase-4 isoform X1 [Vulpes lagopus]|uniref:hyaluronidase-4 isoform X1 n=2 Tax=Vulpes lagopus TaxID=494514 RepID=UPI001BC989BB|nr:hyaluronidase-4 isoform X1 [Vulpes lagopus]XP_041583392.1 hyaluronidase-4 isoform X1 [Vulpes lagopus]XP_041583393.1 hyaluronidase-4 isoform X1 [Vulpes lagopus]XP_041583394.1 hyaluronidase-4 isoform X1 [Vulpes lagopus]